MTPKGIWAKQMQFRPGDIRTIDFDTDYLNSLEIGFAKKKTGVSDKGYMQH